MFTKTLIMIFSTIKISEFEKNYPDILKS